MVLAIVLVFLGGCTGSTCRYGCSGLVAQRFAKTFPFGTLVLNVSFGYVACGWQIAREIKHRITKDASATGAENLG
jgi:fluoride ion exporter CrcB/FEX